MNDFNVLYQSNDAFAPYLGVSLKSLLVNNTEIAGLHVYIINMDISAENMSKIETMCREYGRDVIWIDARSIRARIQELGMPEYKGFRKNTMSLMKIFIADFVDVKNILYIDCDTIITGKLSPLVGLDLGDKAIGMVLDSIIPARYKTDIGLQKESNYFNSGIIYFDLDNWRKKHCIERIVDFANTGIVFGTVDQDYLSVVLNDDIFVLDFTYNVQCVHFLCSPKGYERTFKSIKPFYKLTEVKNALENPAIVHYEKFCGMSPWHKDSVHPCTELFDYYLKMSPWADYEKKPVEKKSIVYSIEKKLYRLLPKDVFVLAFRIASNRMLINSNHK